MQDVIDMLRTAEEGSQELDLAIWRWKSGEDWRWHSEREETITCDRYGPDAAGNPIVSLDRFSRSIDAAILLVPTGFEWECTFSRFVPHQANVSSSRTAHGGWIGEHDHSRAMAICLAALRAQDAQREAMVADDCTRN